MNEIQRDIQPDNDMAWQRLCRLFERREKPVVVWIGGNSQDVSHNQYNRFRSQFAQKFEHIEVRVDEIAGTSIYRYLQQLLAQNTLSNPVFHLRHIPEGNEALIFEVNFERELLFRNLPASIIFWGDDRSEIAFQRMAPDFWDWLVYRFHFDAILLADKVGLVESPRSSSSSGKAETWDRRAARLSERLRSLAPTRDAGGRHTMEYADTALSLGNTLFHLGQLSEARPLFEGAAELFKKEQADLGRAYALKALADLENRLSDVEHARQLYHIAIEIFQTEHDDSGRASALQMLGDLERRLGNVEHARHLYDEAIGLYKNGQDDLGRANALKALGDLESLLGNVERARSLYDDAIGLYKKEQSDLGRANTLRGLGDLESWIGNFERARQLYGESIRLYEKEQVDLGRAAALVMMGELENRLGNVESARKFYEESKGLFEKEQDNLGLANALRAQGDWEAKVGNPARAEMLYRQALMLYQKEQNPGGMINTYLAMALLIYTHGPQGEEQASALTWYNRAIAAARKTEVPYFIQEVEKAGRDLFRES